ncbi:MAG: hypothetical protein HY996_02280 [Micrococcales bacterium]|nr:hypothetical protein [Micrococcales bacterium]
MRHLRVVGLACCLVALGACPSGLEQMESGYRERLQELDGLAVQSDPAKRVEIVQAKAAFQAEYARLSPEQAAREAGLGPINQRMRAYAEQARAYVGQQAAQMQTAQAAQLRAQLVGIWASPEMLLSVSPQGMVEYRRSTGGTNRSVTAPIASVGPAAFDVGVMGMTTTFQVQVPPHDVAGVSRMTVDGVELTRGGIVSNLCATPAGDACATSSASVPASIPAIHGSCSLPWVPRAGAPIRIVWTVEDVGSAAPPNSVVASTDLAVAPAAPNATDYSIHFSFNAPTTGWPAGTYRVEVTLDGQSLSTARFRITPT